MAELDEFDENMRRIAVSQAHMKVLEARVLKNIAEVKAMLAAAGYPVREAESATDTSMTARERFEASMRRREELGAEAKQIAAATEKKIQELRAGTGRPVDAEGAAPPAPPARPVRRAVQALTPSGGNWSVMTGDPSVHVEVDGSFVL